ncbi:MAG: LysR family transcriptional regulator [Coriobacteriales bacterium]|jgi:DNA-binding transcriptional LysR family regulator|nr:LysR family transcriptional regulator [Coriobacteriales bacterium]
MHTEQMRYFELLYQTRSVAAAARLIPMSPQGLVKSMRSLEADLGVALFTDHQGVLTPTPYSEAFHQYTQRWEADYQILEEELKRIKAQERCEIRLGTSLGIIGFMGDRFLDAFEREHPPVSVSYNELSDAFCDANLLKGTYDLAFTLAPYDNRFVTTELYSAQVYFWVNTNRGFKQGDTLSIEDLAGKNIAIPGEDFKIYHTVMALCKAQGVPIQNVFTSNEIFWLYEFVAAGRGIAFTLPHLMKLSTFSSNSSIVALPLEGVQWRFGLSYLSSHKLLPHEELFLEYCKSQRRTDT